MPICADCGAVGHTSDSPKQQVEGAPIEKQVPATPRPLCGSCYSTAFAAEYPGADEAGGPDAAPRPNVGDVPAAPRTSG